VQGCLLPASICNVRLKDWLTSAISELEADRGGFRLRLALKSRDRIAGTPRGVGAEVGGVAHQVVRRLVGQHRRFGEGRHVRHGRGGMRRGERPKFYCDAATCVTPRLSRISSRSVGEGT
jgi:hypothetical protein